MWQSRLISNRLCRHVLFWAGVLSFFFIGFYTQPEVYTADSIDPVPLLTELLFSSLITFLVYTYTLLYGLLPWLLTRRYGWFVIGLISLNLLASLLYNTLAYTNHFFLNWLGYGSTPNPVSIEFRNPFDVPGFFENNLVAGLLVGFRLFIYWRDKQRESQRLEREKLQNELRLIKLRLDSDFLFCALDRLHHLTRNEHGKAPAMVLTLAHFLRYVLYDGQVDTIPLALEVKAIEQYVALQRAIYPTGLEISLTRRGKLDHQRVATQILFQLVKNAFHQLPAIRVGQVVDEPAWVSIDLAVNESQLTLKVINGQSLTSASELNQLADIQKQLYVPLSATSRWHWSLFYRFCS